MYEIYTQTLALVACTGRMASPRGPAGIEGASKPGSQSHFPTRRKTLPTPITGKVAKTIVRLDPPLSDSTDIRTV
jgi:hypothetical protein